MNMSVKSIAPKGVLAACIFALALGFAAPAGANNVTLRPAKPTHYFFTPMANVNPSGHLVLGFHEISYGMPGNLQVQASIIDNIGRTCLAAKYGFASNLSFGGGLAQTLVPMGEHAIHGAQPARLGLFFTYGMAERNNFSMAVTPHTQIGSSISMGVDFGMRLTPTEFWSFIWEIGSSVDINAPMLYLYTIGGLRIHPPKVPILYVDIGVSAKEFAVDPFRPQAGVYVDIIIAFIAGGG
jgi:hypothetical protein